MRHSLAAQLAVLLILAGCLFFIGLGRLPLLEPDEGRNAEVAREMLQSGDWITPHYDTLPYLDKPAVFFGLVAASFKVGGLNELAARFPSALMGLATVLLVWLLARKTVGEGSAVKAGIIFATAPLALIFARLVIFDMTLTFLVTLVMVCFWYAEESGFERRWPEFVMFAAAGVATITKGPVGFLLPLLSLLVYGLVRGRLRELKKLDWALGLAVFLLAALPWFIAVSARNPGFPRYAFWDESLLRFATGHAKRGGGVFYYIPVYLVGFLPWSFFLLFAGANRIRRWRALRDESEKGTAFLLAWAVAVLVFFSVSRSKLPAYFLPAIPPLSVLMARVWEDAAPSAQGGPRRPDWLSAGFASLILIGLLVAAAPFWVRYSSLQTVAQRKVDPHVLPLLPAALLYSGLILAAIGFLGRNLSSRTRHSPTARWATFALLALTVPTLTARWIRPLSAYAAVSSSRGLAQAILRSPESGLPAYGYYYFRTGLSFYLRRPVGLVTGDGDELTSNYAVAMWPRWRRQGAAPALAAAGANALPSPPLVDLDQFQSVAKQAPEGLLVLVRNNEVPQLNQAVSNLEPLWSAWEYSIWKVPPSTH